MIDFKTCLESIWRKKNLNNNSLRTNQTLLRLWKEHCTFKKLEKAQLEYRKEKIEAKSELKFKFAKRFLACCCQVTEKIILGTIFFFHFGRSFHEPECVSKTVWFFSIFSKHMIEILHKKSIIFATESALKYIFHNA